MKPLKQAYTGRRTLLPLALTLSLPELTPQNLFWRLHFTIGALSHVMRCHERHSLVPDTLSVDLGVDELVDVFLDYATAGLEVGRQ